VLHFTFESALAKPKIFLIGEDRDLAELVGAEP
jgi:hypothetical protein